MMTKRQFLRIGLGAGAAAFLTPLLRPTSLLAQVQMIPRTYLDTSFHRYWMKLTYNRGQDSRQARRTLGLALRYMGMMRGQGAGAQFGAYLDQALDQVYRRCVATGQKPGSTFALIQMLYDQSIYPQTGVVGGRILFGMLFSMLRGRDGTAQGDSAHQAYLMYRQAAIDLKNAYRTHQGADAVAEARKRRSLALQTWQRQLKALVELYATRQATLFTKFQLRADMLQGIDYSLAPRYERLPRLVVSRVGAQLVVSWNGSARLQQGPTVFGPWRDTKQSSPARFELNEPEQFFRAVLP